MKVINIIIGTGIFLVVILLIVIIYSINKSNRKNEILSNIENVRNDFSKESEPIDSDYKSNKTLIDDVIRPPITDTLMLEENSFAQPAREFEDIAT